MSTTQWANIGEDAGALHALLARIPEYTAVPTIDFLWIFPPRKIAIGESIVVVIASFDTDASRRRVSTAHFTVARDRKGVPNVSVRFAEHGSAPGSAVPRIVEGVLRRLGEDLEAAPREEQVDGEQERWDALIVESGGRINSPADGDGDSVDDVAAEPGASVDAGQASADAGTDAADAGSAARESTAPMTDR